MRSFLLALVGLCPSCIYTIVEGTSEADGGPTNSSGTEEGSVDPTTAAVASEPATTTGTDATTLASTSGTASEATSSSETTASTDSEALTEPATSTGPARPECGGVFSLDWCPQIGPLEQYTRCQEVLDDGKTCINPEIRYGSTVGGIPSEHPGNALAAWCMQLGFQNFVAVEYGKRDDCIAPHGQVFGCMKYDDRVWHWCDQQDGFWRDSTLDYPCKSVPLIVSVTCQ